MVEEDPGRKPLSYLQAGLNRDLAALAGGSGGSGGSRSTSRHSGSRHAEEGLQETGWGHCEVPQEPWVVLNETHTAESAAAVTPTLREMFPDTPLALVIAMAGDKRVYGAAAGGPPAPPKVDIAGGKAHSAPPGALTAAWQAGGVQVAPPSPRVLWTRVPVQASLAAAVEKARMELADAAGAGRGRLHRLHARCGCCAALRQGCNLGTTAPAVFGTVNVSLRGEP